MHINPRFNANGEDVLHILRVIRKFRIAEDVQTVIVGIGDNRPVPVVTDELPADEYNVVIHHVPYNVAMLCEALDARGNGSYRFRRFADLLGVVNVDVCLMSAPEVQAADAVFQASVAALLQ